VRTLDSASMASAVSSDIIDVRTLSTESTTDSAPMASTVLSSTVTTRNDNTTVHSIAILHDSDQTSSIIIDLFAETSVESMNNNSVETSVETSNNDCAIISVPIEPPQVSSGTRKRKRQPEKWLREVQKHKCQAGECYETRKGKAKNKRSVQPVNCKCIFACIENVNEEQRQSLCAIYWKSSNNNVRRSFIAAHCTARRKKAGRRNTNSRRQLTIDYHVTINDEKIKV